jgi:hypothetical protein
MTPFVYTGLPSRGFRQRHVRLTPDEWIKAAGFLTHVGQACTPARQEFVLLTVSLPG